MALSIAHRLSILDPKSHLCHLETTVTSTEPLPDTLVVYMPVWTPGSYLLREYARHIEALAADPPARATKIRKNAWRIETRGAVRVVIRYRVYANELTVRTSHVDESHAFLAGAALFLCLEEAEDLPISLEIDAPREWRVATTLPAVENGGQGLRRFEARDFDTLVDCPIELGLHREERFDVLGKPHRYAIWPASGVGDADARRLVRDTKAILEREAGLFDGGLPYPSYELLLHLSPRGRGGLEHRDSAALIAPPTSFGSRDSYLDLLSLVAHECFHAWNVKRIRPAGLSPYRYQQECYTRHLWWFEGGTSYYDWRVLLLAQLCTVEEYLDHLASEIAYLDQTPGRLVHSLEEASFDAWIKLYRPDENSANSTVSYYRKGEVVCALLDIEIRARTSGRASLDGVSFGTSGRRTASVSGPSRKMRCSRSSSTSPRPPSKTSSRAGSGRRRRSTSRRPWPSSASPSTAPSGPMGPPARSARGCGARAHGSSSLPWRGTPPLGARASTRATSSSRSAGLAWRGPASTRRCGVSPRATRWRSSSRGTGRLLATGRLTLDPPRADLE